MQFDIRSYLINPKLTPSGWYKINAVCCTHNGESPDTRQRGGIKLSDDGFIYNCFNCGYSTSYSINSRLTNKMKKLLNWFHVPEEIINKLLLQSLGHHIDESEKIIKPPIFVGKTLSSDYRFVNENDVPIVEYLKARKVYGLYPFMVGDKTNGIVIPFTYHGKIIGHTIRNLGDNQPKYLNDSQSGYVFGIDFQKPQWNYTIVCEGIFDAISVDGCAVMHNTINDQQLWVLRQLGKQIIVVPDHDEAGQKLVDIAIENNWYVSIPNWGNDVKDINDSVVKYGRIATIAMIMKYMTKNKITIKMAQKGVFND